MEAGNLIHEAYRHGLRKGDRESSGRNESERIGGLESVSRRPSPQPGGEGSTGGRNLIGTTVPLRRGDSDGTMTRTCRATGEALLAPARNCRRKVGTITGGTGKCTEGERVAERCVVCAGQRPDQVGSNPTGARIGGAISKGGTPYHFVKYEARKKCHSNRKKSASPKQVLGDCE